MLKHKKYRFVALAFLLLSVVSAANMVLSNSASATTIDPGGGTTTTPGTLNINAGVSRINRMTLLMGTTYFYDSNTTDSDWTFKSIGLTCSAEIKYATAGSTGGRGGTTTGENWNLTYTTSLESGSGCGPESSKSLTKPSNWSERQYVVFAGGSSDGKIISVKPDSSVSFTKKGTYNGNTVYIQDGVDPYSCPLVIRKNNDWYLKPLEKKDKEADVSNQIKTLFDKELGVGDTACGPTDNDKLGIFSQFGLPESYYNAGHTKSHYGTTDFGFDGKAVAGANLGTVPTIAEAAGIALNGPLKGGGYDGSSDSTATGSAGDASPTTCAVDGIGWIICPVMGFVAKVNDSAFAFLKSFLGIRPSLINSDGTVKAWQAFRDIANVAFVIAFLVIVYSQLTSAGISNYGIKKMLPRIIIAAILVNLSYFICALMVDISNILGSSIYSLLKSFDVGASGSDPSWQTMISGPDGILATAATGIAVVLLAIAIFLAPTTLLAFAVVILILIARQAFVILLLVISPLAFVAYLLPNTESWFKKWWKALTATLMVYPIVGAVFGASTLAANILSTEDSSLMRLIALGVLAVPLFAVPALLKGSLSAAGSVGSRLQGMADRAQGRAGSQGKRRAQELGKDMKNRFNIAANDNDSRLGKSKLGAYSRWQNRRTRGRQDRETAANRAADLRFATDMINTDSDGNFTAQALRMQKASAGGVGVANEKAQVRARALATQRTFKQWDDDVSAFQTMQTGLSHEQLAQKQIDSNLSAEERAAAAGTIASRDFRAGHNDALAKMHEQMAAADDAHREATAEYQAAVQNGGDTKEAQEKLDRANKEIEIQSNIQKQFKGQWKEKSFGMGDSAMGELGEGKYGRIVEREKADGTKVEVRSNDIYTDTRIRAEEKLNEQGLVTMNPDDLNIIVKAAEEDPQSPDALTDSQLQVVTERIAAARANKETNKLIKKDASDKFDRIIAKARSRGIPIPDVPASTPSPEPPSAPDSGPGPTPDPGLDGPR